MSDFPPTSLQHASYADDFTSWASSSSVPTAAEILTGNAEDVANWANKKDFQISTQKSTATLFTSENRQSQLNPNITLNSHPLPLDRRPKILGVTYDTHLTFSPHINSVTDRAASRLSILKSLAGSTWGQQKETLAFTYKCLLRPLHTYAAPVWFPNASDSAIRKLQTTQNSALRITTGSLKMSPITHLHSETKILPVREHLSLLCKQFLVSALRPHHPSHRLVTDNTNRRPRHTPIRYTLQSKFLPSIQYVLADGLDSIENYKEAISTLHTDCVRSTLESFPDNPVLQSPAPDVHPDEEELPRAYRTSLSQLRSGYSRLLNSYRHRIGIADSPLCPSCGLEDHSTSHIFACTEHPTELTVRDLWERPGRVAQYLESLPFIDLPALARPPPEPPPPLPL